MEQRGGLPLVNTDIPQLQGPQVFEQPRGPQFTYTEQVPITPQYRFDIDPGINWAELGSQAFAVAADIYGKSLNYMAQTKANKLQDLTNITQKKLNGMAEQYETGQMAVPPNMNPVQYAAEQAAKLKEEFRFKARDIIGDFSYEQDGKKFDIFDDDYKLDGLGVVWQDIIVSARGTNIGLDEVIDRQVLSINKAFGQQQETGLQIQRYLSNEIPYDQLSKDAKTFVNSPYYNGTQAFPVEQGFGIDPATNAIYADEAGNPMFMIQQTDTGFIARRNPEASLSGLDPNAVQMLVQLDSQFSNNLGVNETVNAGLKAFLASPSTINNSALLYNIGMYSALPESTQETFARQAGFSEQESFQLNAASTSYKLGSTPEQIKSVMTYASSPETMQTVMGMEKMLLTPAVTDNTLTYASKQGYSPEQEAARAAKLQMFETVGSLMEAIVTNAGIPVPAGAFKMTDGVETITEEDQYTIAGFLQNNPSVKSVVRQAMLAAVSAQNAGTLDTDEERKAFVESFAKKAAGKFMAIDDGKGGITMTTNPELGMLSSRLQNISQAEVGGPKTVSDKLVRGFKGTLVNNTSFIPASKASEMFGDIDTTLAIGAIQAGGVIRRKQNVGAIMQGLPQAEQLRIYAASKKDVILAYSNVGPNVSYADLTEEQKTQAFQAAYQDIPQAHLWDLRLLQGERNSINVGSLPFGIAGIPLVYGGDLVRDNRIFIQELLQDGMIQPQDRSGNPGFTYSVRGEDARDTEKKIGQFIGGFNTDTSTEFTVAARGSSPVSSSNMDVTSALVNVINKYEQDPQQLERSLAIASQIDSTDLLPPLKNKTADGFAAWVAQNSSKLAALSESTVWPFTKEQTKQFVDYVNFVANSEDEAFRSETLDAFVTGIDQAIPMGSIQAQMLGEQGLSGSGIVIAGVQIVDELMSNNQPETVNTNFELFIDAGIFRPEFDKDLLRINSNTNASYGLLFYNIGHPAFEDQILKASGYDLYTTTAGQVVALEKDEINTDSSLTPISTNDLLKINKQAIASTEMFNGFNRAVETRKEAKLQQERLKEELSKTGTAMETLRDLLEPISTYEEWSPSVKEQYGISDEEWTKRNEAKPWWSKSYSLTDWANNLRGWWQSSGTEVKKEVEQVYPELATILNKVKSEKELIEYAPQFSKFIESVLEPNMPSASEKTKTTLQEQIEKQQALRKASKEQIVKASQGITLEEARAKLKAEETERTERKLIETSKADISKVVTVLSDLGQTIVSDMRKAIKENKNKADLRKSKTVDGFVFKFYGTTTLQKAYEKIYGKEKTEELFKQALEFRQIHENISGTTKDSLPSYSDEARNRVVPQYSSDLRLSHLGGIVPGKKKKMEGDFMYLDRQGVNSPDVQLHEMTHAAQPVSNKKINPFWKDHLQEVYSVAKEFEPKEKHANLANFIEYIFSEVEMPAWLAAAKADYYLRYNKTFNPETATFENISEMFEKLSSDASNPNAGGYQIWGIMLKTFPKNDKYRKAIKDIFNSVAVVIPDTNERIA